MSNESESVKDDASSTSSSPSAPTPKLTENEALDSLEDHRCAICNSILISACRIGCGHTFCRHCLNIDRENRCNERGKPTCYICDAAVTEISQNPERDKEIDKLYTCLAVNDQLSRARAKSERKTEEEEFANKPKRDPSQRQNARAQQNPDDGFERGDATYTDEGAAWTDSGPYLNSLTTGENDDHSVYCTASYSCCPDEEEHQHQFHPHYEERDTNHGFDSSDFSQPSSCHHSTPPIVIHHTVQHVYHTMEVRHDGGNNGNTESGDEAHFHDRSEPFRWNHRTEQFHSPQRFRDHPTSCRRPMTFQNCNCPYRNSPPTYTSNGYYNMYGAQPVQSPYPCYAGGMCGFQRPIMPPFYSFPNYTDESSQHDHDNFRCNEDRSTGQSTGSSCESLCEFHRAMREHEQKELEESMASCSLSSLHYDSTEPNMGHYENDDDLLPGHDILRVNVRLPFPVADNNGRRMSNECSMRQLSRSVNGPENDMGRGGHCDGL